jgi:hypothetical protein
VRQHVHTSVDQDACQLRREGSHLFDLGCPTIPSMRITRVTGPIAAVWLLGAAGTVADSGAVDRASGPRARGGPDPVGSVGPLSVSANHRFLQRADGSPFFWLGDTAWLLFSLPPGTRPAAH